MEKTFKKDLKKICKAYSKKLATWNKFNTKNLANPIGYFVDYLRFLRDFLIMCNYDKQSEKAELSLTALVIAIEEYEQYIGCTLDHLTVENTVQLIKDGKLEEANKLHAEAREKHWKKFWRLVELNIEEWFDCIC